MHETFVPLNLIQKESDKKVFTSESHWPSFLFPTLASSFQFHQFLLTFLLLILFSAIITRSLIEAFSLNKLLIRPVVMTSNLTSDFVTDWNSIENSFLQFQVQSKLVPFTNKWNRRVKKIFDKHFSCRIEKKGKTE